MKQLFLLGGNDLEMDAIRDLLKNNSIKPADKNLAWGAKLSDYKEFLNFEGTIYGIELEEDITPPSNYVEIDHHGKNDHKKSSLEQVAEILGVKLDDDQMLIAANDARYISGMKSLCAKQEKIDKIRAKDRASQGVTEEDEELALQSFNIALSDKTNVIYSKTSHFSAVSDLAYYKYDNYIIYNDTKVVFYGYKRENIIEFFKEQNIQEGSYYYGGGEFGFVGIKGNVCTRDDIESLITEFKKEKKKDKIYSYHTFMLPFTFSGNFDKKNNWEYKPFEIKEQRNYNEFVYFYKHVQDAIYNKENENEENWISKYYEYKEQKGTYTINCKKGIFELELDGISLRIFNTNVAILSFNLKNTNYSSLDDILAINDFGRRIYPQFLGKNFTCDTKNAILANSLTLTFEKKEPIKEDFTRFDNLLDIKLLPNFITDLVEKNFQKDKEGKTTIRQIIDDRMFVISQYHNDELIKKLKFYKQHCNKYEYETSDDWYRYLFIDGDDKTCQSKNMTKKLISESTYDRWIEWGTLFGISRYSFVAFTGSWFGKNRLLPHMQTMYFQMFTLLLAYRATIIKFADDIQYATTNDNEITQKTKEVYKKYLNFLNKLYFKEITAQDQGIELYNQAIKIMDIETYMNDLDNEINELHGYVDLKEEKKRNDTLTLISKIGAVLLPPSLMAGLFGMNVLTVNGTEHNQLLAFMYIVLSGIVGLLITLDWKSIFNIKKLKKSISEIIATGLKFLISLIFILLVLNSFNFFDKFDFNFLKDSLFFNKKLEMVDDKK
ncbi:MAG: CorA family divalent cation transporter [Sulfurimonas sp.]|nr:CorA family divalent cation transporter [Sulfurimonas sp.]